MAVLQVVGTEGDLTEESGKRWFSPLTETKGGARAHFKAPGSLGTFSQIGKKREKRHSETFAGPNGPGLCISERLLPSSGEIDEGHAVFHNVGQEGQSR